MLSLFAPVCKADLLADLGRTDVFGGKGMVIGSRLQNATKHRELREGYLQTQVMFVYNENEDEKNWGDLNRKDFSKTP